MKYIFFDIESADGTISIVEFGYIITDTKFNILEKHEFLMNPEYRYNYGVKLRHSKKEYSKSPNFIRFYETIKKLLTQKDILIFGFSVGNDIRYIGNNCLRYGLKHFEYNAIDIQRIFDNYIKSNNMFTSLKDASKIIVPNEEYKHLIDHGALDDAIKTMLVLKNIIKVKDIETSKLFDNETFKINSIKYFDNILKNRKLKLQREKNRKECNALWKNFYSQYFNLLNKNKNKLVSISTSIKFNKVNLMRAINYIKAKNYCPTKDLPNAKYIIVESRKDKDNIVKSLNNKSNYKFIFKDLLN